MVNILGRGLSHLGEKRALSGRVFAHDGAGSGRRGNRQTVRARSERCPWKARFCQPARRALRAGAAGFVPKTLGPEMLIAAVNEMVGGGIYRPLDFLAESDDDASDVALTPRELDVLKGLSEGKANKEIARELEIQEVTVKLHVKTLSRKLNARNRTHAAMLGRDLGLV